MTMQRIAGVCLLLLLIPFTAAAQSVTTSAIRLDQLDGSTATIGDYLKTGPVYMTFWALWCGPCKEELRALQTIAKKHPESRFTILAVNQDSPKSLHEVKSYVRSRGIAFPVILDPDRQVFEAFNGQSIPFAVLIDTDGKVSKTRIGYLPGDAREIEAEILSLVR
jgi:cytochrome c biogenesis protein CcmG, thiol:disulfide interchange protein DsbE